MMGAPVSAMADRFGGLMAALANAGLVAGLAAIAIPRGG
jgi:hypothetical protein